MKYNEYMKEYHQAQSKAYFEENKKRVLVRQKARRKRDRLARKLNPQSFREKEKKRYTPKRRLQTTLGRLGFKVDSYEAMVVVQKNACAICKKTHKPTGFHTRLNVDHDHRSGKIRELLCNTCNRFLIPLEKLTKLEAISFVTWLWLI
jgi:hypothetical protein